MNFKQALFQGLLFLCYILIMANHLIIIDSNSVIHRAYHALPPLTTKSGELVNAVYGFLLVFLRAVKDFRPDFVAACFDFPAPSFRHKQYKGYKATRPPTKPELYNQIPLVKEALSVFNVRVFEKEGFEADDLIGTLSCLAQTQTIVLSGDLDVLQLVSPNTKVYVLRKGVKDIILYDEKLVKERYSLTPKQLLDFRALKGDPSDNIPGVLGIGEKTATELIKEYGCLENIYDNIALIPGKNREKLIRHKEEAFLSRQLSQIDKMVPLDFDLEKCRFGDYDKKRAKEALERFEFYSLINKLP